MTDMHAGLLHFGFRAGKERLSALVQSLRHLDFFVLEDLRSAESLSGTPCAGLIVVLDEDLLFVDDVIRKLTDPQVSFTMCCCSACLCVASRLSGWRPCHKASNGAERRGLPDGEGIWRSSRVCAKER